VLLKFDIPPVEAVFTAVGNDIAGQKAFGPILFNKRPSQ
jgi:hypothetical protein